MHVRFFVPGIFFAFLTSHPAAAAPAYSVVDLGTIGDPTGYVSATGINDAGQVVGYCQTTNGARGFIYSAGVMTDIGSFGGTFTVAYGINNSGQVVGISYSPENGPFKGPSFLYQNGVMTDLKPYFSGNAVAINDAGQIVGESSNRASLYSAGVQTDLGTLGGFESGAAAINSHGDIVGASYARDGSPPDGAQHGFLYSKGRMIDLGYLDRQGYGVYATSINSHGQIVGAQQVHTTAQERAFLYQKGKMTDLGTLGGNGSYAAYIGDDGVIVGSSQLRKGQQATHAIIYAKGKMTDLNKEISPASGWVLTSATARNKSGQIIGQGIIRTLPHAFLLTPVPVVTISGATERTTSRSRYVVRGKATSVVSSVLYRNGTKGSFKTATGTNRWHFTVRLHPGRNVIAVRAQGFHIRSAARQAIITRS